MKDKKTILGSSAAIVAAAALIAGGTFAAWSDFALIEDNEAVAGELVLNAEDRGAIFSRNGGPLAPGENKITYRYVANRSDDTVALEDALLELRIVNLEDQDNGCSSDGEAAAEQGSETGLGAGTPNATICNADGGEFSQEAWMQVRRSDVVEVDDAADCASVGTSPLQQMRLADWASAPAVSLGTLDPGEGVCLAFELGLPNGEGSGTEPPGIDFAGGATSTNESQGDSATFDVRLDLTQQVS